MRCRTGLGGDSWYGCRVQIAVGSNWREKTWHLDLYEVEHVMYGKRSATSGFWCCGVISLGSIVHLEWKYKCVYSEGINSGLIDEYCSFTDFNCNKDRYMKFLKFLWIVF